MRLQQIFEKIRPQLGSGSRVFGGFVAGSMALNLGPAARQRLQKWFRGADFQAQKWETELGLNGGFQQHGWHGSDKWETAFWGFKFWQTFELKTRPLLERKEPQLLKCFPIELQAVERVNVEVPADRQRSGIPRLRLTAQTDLNLISQSYIQIHSPCQKCPRNPGQWIHLLLRPLSIYLFIYLSIYLFIYVSIYLFIYLSI